MADYLPASVRANYELGREGMMAEPSKKK